jgi:hypothetical protein
MQKGCNQKNSHREGLLCQMPADDYEVFGMNYKFTEARKNAKSSSKNGKHVSLSLSDVQQSSRLKFMRH